MAPGNSTRYHVLPRDSVDSDRESDSREYLLPSPTGIDIGKLPKTYSITVNPVVILRILSGILGFSGFMVMFLGSGHSAFIASDVFLMLTVVLNIITLLHYAVSKVLRVTVEFREQALNLGRGSFTRPNISSYFDLIFSIGLMISLLVGWSTKNRWDVNGGEVAASVLGYIVVGFQVILAVPMLDRLTFTFRAALKSKDSENKGSYMAYTPNMKSSAASNTVGNETSAIPKTNQSRHVAGDFV